MCELESRIRAIPDFPKPGILYRDITPLLGDPEMLDRAARELAAPFAGEDIQAVAGIEARGFIFGCLVARELSASFVPVRKPGKLPYRKISESYTLEYGTGTVEMHVDAVAPESRVLVVDDLVATGGTAAASCTLVERLGGVVAGCAFVIELDGLGGRGAPRRTHRPLPAPLRVTAAPARAVRSSPARTCPVSSAPRARGSGRPGTSAPRRGADRRPASRESSRPCTTPVLR